MPIWGWVCTGLTLLAVAFFIYAGIGARKEERYYRENGEALLGWIVQANNDLFTAGTIGKPAQILIAFDAEPDPPDSSMSELAARVADLKNRKPRNEVEAEVAKIVKDESYRPFERFKLPTAFTNGRKVYSMHIWILRSSLPGRKLQHAFVRCLVLKDDPKSRPLMIDYQPDDDDYLE